jgi:type I restriction enzyme, S subunit
MKQETKMTPALRFPEFSDDWQTKSLGEVSENIMYGLNSSAIAYDGTNKYIRITDIDDSSREFVPNPLTSPDGVLDDKYKLESGDIVFARTGASVGKSYLYKEKEGIVFFAGFLIRFSIRNANPYFVHTQTLRPSYKKWLRSMSMRSGQPGVNAEEYRTFKFLLPSEPEQQKIATFLSAVDEKIGLLAKKKELLLKYKEGVVRQIFDQKIRFKDDNGNDFPDWTKSPLGTLCKIYDGTHMTPDYKESGVPFYSVEHVTANNFSETKYIAEDVYESEKKRVVLEKGDILMTRIGDIGTSKYISWDVKASFYVSLALIKNSPKINPIYLDQFMKSDIFQQELHRRTLHVAFPKKINLGEISDCSVLTPVKEEQTKIAKLLSAVDQRIELLTKQAERLTTFKKGLLQQMFV